MDIQMKKLRDPYEDINSQDLQERVAIANLLGISTTATWKQISKAVFKEIFKLSNNSNKKPEFLSESPKLLALEKYLKRLRQKELESMKEDTPIIFEIINDTSNKIFEKIIKSEENIFITKKPVGEKIHIGKPKPEGRSERFAREKQLAEAMGKGQEDPVRVFNSFEELRGMELRDIEGLDGTGIGYKEGVGNNFGNGAFFIGENIKLVSNPELHKNNPHLKTAEISFTIYTNGFNDPEGKIIVHYLDYRK